MTSFRRRDADRGRPEELLSSISSRCFFSSNRSLSLGVPWIVYLSVNMLSPRRRPEIGLTGEMGEGGPNVVGVATSGVSGPDSSTVSICMISFFSLSEVALWMDGRVFWRCKCRLTSIRLLK